MSLKLSNISEIKRILVISLSNIGDVILTFPVLDALKAHFREAKISVVVGPKAESLLKGNPHFEEVYIFEKHQRVTKIFRWLRLLSARRFDLVIDLRNTLIPYLIFPRHKTSFLFRSPSSCHMRLKHMRRLQGLLSIKPVLKRFCIFSSESDKAYVEALLKNRIDKKEKRFVLAAPGAAHRHKRWTEEGFAKLCDRLSDSYPVEIIFVGDQKEQEIVQRILKLMVSPGIDLSGQLTLAQLGYLISKCSLAIMNDSGPMHLASYLNIPTIALFGPSDPLLYGPWSEKSLVLRKNQHCQVCQGVESEHTCLKNISVDDVWKSIVGLWPAEILS